MTTTETIAASSGQTGNILLYVLLGVVIALIILVVVLLVKTVNLEKKYSIFMKGSDGADLESSIFSRFKEIDKLKNGDGDEDFRIFVHSSAQLVERTVNVLLKTKRLVPPATGHHVYLTHLGIKYRNWPVEKINAELPPTLRAAKDGLEVTIG